MGSPKKKETLGQLFNNISLLNFKWGRIDVRFAPPFSLKEHIIQARPSNWSDTLTSENVRVMLQSLSFKILAEINNATVIMPTAIVGTIVITLRGNGGIGEQEMLRKVNWLKMYLYTLIKRKILKKGGRVADFGGMTTKQIVTRYVFFFFLFFFSFFLFYLNKIGRYKFYEKI